MFTNFEGFNISYVAKFGFEMAQFGAQSVQPHSPTVNIGPTREPIRHQPCFWFRPRTSQDPKKNRLKIATYRKVANINMCLTSLQKVRHQKPAKYIKIHQNPALPGEMSVKGPQKGQDVGATWPNMDAKNKPKQDEAHEPECRHYVEEQKQYLFIKFSSEPTCGTPCGDTLTRHSCRTPLLDTNAQGSCKTPLLDTIT